MNTKAIGEITEGIILAHFLKKGMSVSIPFGNNQRYDFILDENGRLLRAQCKTGKLDRYGSVRFSTRSTNGFTGQKRQYIGNADIFLVYCPQTDKVYRIPITDLVPKDAMALRTRPTKNSQKSGINLAKDFEV